MAAFFVAYLRNFYFANIDDTVTPGLILGTALGRFACIINGDTWGSPTTIPWGFVYKHPKALVPLKGVALHPTPLYEMLWGVAIFSFLYPLRSRFRTPGVFFLLFVILYFSGRFFIEFFRGDSHYIYGIRIAQFISLAAVIIAAPSIFILWKKEKVFKYQEQYYGSK